MSNIDTGATAKGLIPAEDDKIAALTALVATLQDTVTDLAAKVKSLSDTVSAMSDGLKTHVTDGDLHTASFAGNSDALTYTVGQYFNRILGDGAFSMMTPPADPAADKADGGTAS